MHSHRQQVVLVTGASSGLGAACAERLAARGHLAFGTTRRSADEPIRPWPGLVRMDVDDEASVSRAVEQVLAQAGRLDAVVNNAGWGLAGAVEETTVAEAKALFETNLWGVLRVCRAVLPMMRAQGGGCIVNVSSMAGRVGLPFQGLYSASKFALEGMTEALRMEVRPFGIRVVLVEPGDLCTGFTDRRRRTQASRAGGAYAERLAAAMAVAERDERSGPGPDGVAQVVARSIEDSTPRLRHAAGPCAPRLAAAAARALPGRLVERFIRRHYGMT